MKKMTLDPARQYATCGSHLIAQLGDYEAPAKSAPVTNFRKLDDEDTWLGTISVFGQLMHLYAIRVTDTDPDGVQVGTNDPYQRLDGVSSMDPNGAFQTVEIPGLDGEYVLASHAYLD